MTTHVELRSGSYYDSVSLMKASAAVADVAGVTAALVAMATPLNLGLYTRLGFPAERVSGAGPNDLLVAVATVDDGAMPAALTAVETALVVRTTTSGGSTDAPAHRTVGSALHDGGTLALISVPGRHAFIESLDAVRRGVSVMLFSDNVTVEQEIALKDEAARHGALVMGPDCGTAVVGGVGLGFANALRPGPVGIVAASGTGAQQVSCLLDLAGVGVSAVLGVGGRDLSRAVGGRSTVAAMRLLDEHPETELVVVLSKPPDPVVADSIRTAARSLTTPAEVAFVGRGQDDLTAVTDKVLAALGRHPLERRTWTPAYDRRPRPGFVRGLFSGGTLCDEAMAISVDSMGPVASNTPLDPAWTLDGDLRAPGHLMIDFGDDQLTQGRAHPMIDPALRLERIAVEADDPDCAVLLLDVVLGYGAHPDPAADLAPALRAARGRAAATGRDLAVVVALVGSNDDPQGLDRTAAALAAAGASVHLSNADAARTAAALIERPRP